MITSMQERVHFKKEKASCQQKYLNVFNVYK